MLCHSKKNKETSADRSVFHYLVELVPIEEGKSRLWWVWIWSVNLVGDKIV